MKTRIKTLIAAALAGTALFATLPASAHDGDRDGWDRGDRREWRRDDWRGDHWRHHHHHQYFERDRVVIRERAVPVYRNYYYAEPVPYRYAEPVRYRYAEPSIVLGVSLPPVVIPLR